VALHGVSAIIERFVGAGSKIRAYYRRVGARTIRKRDASVRRKQEALTIWKIAGIIAFPLVAASILVSIDIRSDLSELKSAGAETVGWSELASWKEAPGRVRMIGYMMDGYQPSRDGATVDMFVLLPEAGQLLHAAHRIPNQMVEVRPSRPVIFRYREMVWAVGMLNRTFGVPETARRRSP